MIWFLSYYLTSILMTIYLSKEKGLEFEATVGGKKFTKGLSLFLCSPLLLPFMLLVWYSNVKRK